MKEKLKLVLGILMMVIGLIYGFVITFSNIDITQTRLLITYWKEYLIISVMIVVGRLLVNQTK